MGRKSNAGERRIQIIWGLFDCLSEKGHETVTIKKIAESAKLPPGVIHYYFKNKDEIIAELISLLQVTYQQLWDNALHQSVKSNLVETGIHFLIDTMILDPKLNRVLYNLVQMGFEKKIVRQALRKSYGEYRRQLAEVFFNTLPVDLQKTKSVAMLAIVEGLAIQWMIEPEVLDKENIKKLLFKTIEN